MREHALDNLTLGIDRATRLVDQLLTLSRLDSLSDLAELAPIDWNDLVTMTGGAGSAGPCGGRDATL